MSAQTQLHSIIEGWGGGETATVRKREKVTETEKNAKRDRDRQRQKDRQTDRQRDRDRDRVDCIIRVDCISLVHVGLSLVTCHCRIVIHQELRGCAAAADGTDTFPLQPKATRRAHLVGTFHARAIRRISVCLHDSAHGRTQLTWLMWVAIHKCRTTLLG